MSAAEMDRALKAYREANFKHVAASQSLKTARENFQKVKALHEKTDAQVLALQSTGQQIGDVIRQLTPEKCLGTSCTLPSHHLSRHINPFFYPDQSSSSPVMVPVTSLVVHHIWIGLC
jgi:hypothetical protein